MQDDDETPIESDAPKVGRPIGSFKLVETDELLKQIEGLARIQCTQREAAAVLRVHRDTFANFLGSHEKAAEAWVNGHEQGKASLRRLQYKAAEGGNATMQIWLGKQWLEQRDSLNVDGNLNVNASKEQLEARAAQLLGKAGIGLAAGGTGTEEGET